MVNRAASIPTVMKTHPVRIGTLMLAATLAIGVEAGGPAIATNWKEKDGDWSGSFDDAGHWSANAVPAVSNMATIAVSTDATVTLPSGEYDTLAALHFNITGQGKTLTWDGSGTVFRQVTSAVDNYNDEPFGFRWGGNHFFNFQTYADAVGIRYRQALSTITNGVFRLSYPASGPRARLDFDSGYWNFYQADGVTATPARYFIIGQNGGPGGDVEVNFHPGTRFIFPEMQIPNNLPMGKTLSMNFLGGEHDVMSKLSIPLNIGYTDRDTVTFFLVTNNASLTFHGATTIGYYIPSGTYVVDGALWGGKRVTRFDVAAGGMLAFKNTFKQEYSGPMAFNVGDGGTLAFGGSTLVGGIHSTGRVDVARGGTFTGGGTLIVGSSGRGELTVDGGTLTNLSLTVGNEADGEGYVTFTNDAHILTKELALKKGEIDLSEGIAWTNTGYARIGYGNGTVGRLAVNAGAEFRAIGQFEVGSANGIGTLDILGGTVWQHDPNNKSLYMYVGNAVTSTGTVNLVDGTLKSYRINIGKGNSTFNMSGGRCEVNDSVYVGFGTDPGYLGKMEMSGGVLVVGGTSTGYGNLGIGNNGGGEMVVSGGEVDTCYIFLGQTARANVDWATLRQTGGYIHTRLASYRADVGVKMADVNGRNTRIILDGGRLRTHRIFGNCSRAAGKTGYAALSANGGTLEAPFASAGLIDLLDEAKLGPKGLTVKSDYPCTIPQSFTDADDAPGAGLLTLAGMGVKTLTPTNSSFGVLAVAGGTALFAPHAANGMQAVQDSSVVVTNNATLSLVGAQTSLTVRDLTLGDAASTGVLEVDVGDVIRVTGTLTVNAGQLVLSDGFEVGNEYNIIEVTGNRTAELAEAWTHLVVRGAAAAGAAYMVGVAYDEAANRTYVKLTVTDMAAGDVTAWRGPGTDWATAANWSDGVPGMADIALFDSETAPATVAIAEPRQVGGLVFDAQQGYTVSGGMLAVQTTVDARIDATQGVNAVESSLLLPGSMPVTVASGAKLTLGGQLMGNGLVKQGAGRLALTNSANVLGGTLAVTGGIFAVSSLGAVGGAVDVKLHVGALELGGAEGEETAYTAPLTLNNPVSTNAVTLRTLQDVTMAAPTLVSGQPYKDGAGRLTLTSGSAVSLATFDGTTVDWCPGKGNIGIVALDADGVVTDGTVLAAYTVAEGELRLYGLADNLVTFNATHYFAVGVPGVKNLAAAPALTVDHALLNNNAGARHMMLGAGLTDSNSDITDIYLTATNGAEVSCNTLYVGREASRKNVTYHITADNATISTSWRTQANCNSGTGSKAEYIFRNGSKFLVGGSLNMAYRSTFTFDASTLARNASLALATFTYKQDYTGYDRAGGDFLFRNGSKVYLACDLGGANSINPSQANPTTLTFDDSEWIPVVGSADCTFAYPSPAKFGLCTTNTGLVLNVPAACTWTMAQAVKGTGGLVKRGAGTLVFDTHKVVSGGATNNWANATTTLDFTGTLALESGKVIVKNGAAAAGAKFALAVGTELDLDGGTISVGALSGTGAVKNGTVTGTIPLTLNSDWTVAEDLVAFDAATVDFGRVVVDLGRTAENPVTQPFGTVVVGRYAGDTPPDVRRWRVAGAGMDGVVGTFTAADGEIRMTLRLKGGFISFR